jgi:fatty acid desaturase
MDNPCDGLPPSRALRDLLLAAFAGRDRRAARRRTWRRIGGWALFALWIAGCLAAGGIAGWVLGGK